MPLLENMHVAQFIPIVHTYGGTGEHNSSHESISQEEHNQVKPHCQIPILAQLSVLIGLRQQENFF